MVAASHAMGIEIRAAVHTGEVELVGDDVRGIAVHVAARVVALAGAGEVLVTSTTADLLEGSGIPLKDAGAHELKGLSGARQVWRVGAGASGSPRAVAGRRRAPRRYSAKRSSFQGSASLL